MKVLSLAVATGLALSLCAGGRVWAHHSQTMFDMTQCNTLSGTVRTFQFGFPHSWLWVVEMKADGTELVWGFESAAPVQMAGVDRRWTRTVVKKGDKVTVRFSPLKDGKPGGGAMAVLTLPDGTALRAATPACSKELGAPVHK